MKVKVVTVLNNFGQERYIVRYTNVFMFLYCIPIITWETVQYSSSSDPFFYEDKDDAMSKAKLLLANANPHKQRVVEVLNEDEVTDIDPY